MKILCSTKTYPNVKRCCQIVCNPASSFEGEGDRVTKINLFFFLIHISNQQGLSVALQQTKGQVVFRELYYILERRSTLASYESFKQINKEAKGKKKKKLQGTSITCEGQNSAKAAIIYIPSSNLVYFCLCVFILKFSQGGLYQWRCDILYCEDDLPVVPYP